MDRQQLQVEPREEIGKWAVRRLRNRGLVPGVIYGKETKPMAVQVDARALGELMKAGQRSLLVDLRLPGVTVRNSPTVMIREVQRDPLTGKVLNVDFHSISLKERVHATVQVMLVGEPEAIKRGGTLEHLLREVEIQCLPTDLPDHFELEVSQLDMGDSLHVSDLVPPPNVTILTSAEEVVAVMAAPRLEEEAAPAPAEAEAIPEPEVTGQKSERKEKEEEE